MCALPGAPTTSFIPGFAGTKLQGLAAVRLGLNEILDELELKERRIDVEQVNPPTSNADARANHRLGDSFAVEEK